MMARDQLRNQRGQRVFPIRKQGAQYDITADWGAGGNRGASTGNGFGYSQVRFSGFFTNRQTLTLFLKCRKSSSAWGLCSTPVLSINLFFSAKIYLRGSDIRSGKFDRALRSPFRNKAGNAGRRKRVDAGTRECFQFGPFPHSPRGQKAGGIPPQKGPWRRAGPCKPQSE